MACCAQQDMGSAYLRIYHSPTSSMPSSYTGSFIVLGVHQSSFLFQGLWTSCFLCLVDLVLALCNSAFFHQLAVQIEQACQLKCHFLKENISYNFVWSRSCLPHFPTPVSHYLVSLHYLKWNHLIYWIVYLKKSLPRRSSDRSSSPPPVLSSPASTPPELTWAQFLGFPELASENRPQYCCWTSLVSASSLPGHF